MNHLYYGDNLQILREHIKDESVDLVYLDPPFNSDINYNIFFKSPTGGDSEAQIEAFEDTWQWNEKAEEAFDDVIKSGETDAAEMLRAMRAFLRESDMMAYICMMAIRLIELRRVLKASGSIYLHCDTTASHYLKILMDSIFGGENFRNEIVWKRAETVKGNFGQGTRFFDRNTDSLLFYSKDEENYFNQIFTPYTKEYLDQFYKYYDEQGRRYQLISMTGPGGAAKGNPYYEFLGVSRYWRYSQARMRELFEAGEIVQTKPGNVPRRKQYLGKGVPCQSLWDDIPALSSQSSERLGYPTQKPLALMERILTASCPEHGTVLDPFCGCGTTIHAAQKLGRTWIGIDITHLAISLIEKRLKDAFPGIQFEIEGTPKDIGGARALATADKYQFQWWAVSLVNALPYGGKKKGADTGIDGTIYFKPDGKMTEKAIVSVKGGENVSVAMIRDLGHVIDREKAKIGIFITLAEPTSPMITEAIKAGFYETPYGKFPKLQIYTIRELFIGTKPQLPWIDPNTFKKATREASGVQDQLDL